MHRDLVRLPTILFFPIAEACYRDVERFMKHPQFIIPYLTSFVNSFFAAKKIDTK